MSKFTPISVINEHLADGAAIEAFRGTLTRLYDQRERGSGESAFTKQEGEIKDDTGTIIKVEFRAKPGDPAIGKDRVGKGIILTSTKTEKHGLKGVTVMDDTYQEKTTRKLKIMYMTTANIEWSDGGTGNAPAQQTQSAGSATGGGGGGFGSASKSTAPATHTGDPRADGQRAGMCIGRAVELLIAAGVTRESLLGDGSTFAKDVYFLSSKLCLVAMRLEQGKLDPRTLPAKKEQQGPTDEEKRAAAEEAARREREEQRRREAEEQRRREDQEREQAARSGGGGTGGGGGALDDEDEIPF